MVEVKAGTPLLCSLAVSSMRKTVGAPSEALLPGYSLGLTYTSSKLMEAMSFLNPGDAQLARSIGQYDRPHRINFTGVYDIPIGRGRKIASLTDPER